MKVFWAVLLFSVMHKSNALRCYTCSVTENDADTACADDVASLGKSAITDCDKKYCTITRLDYKDPRGKLSSMARNCADKVQPDGIYEDGTFRTYLRSCKTDLCNSGSGKGSSGEGKAYLGDKSTIIVPGSGRSGSSILYTSVIGLVGCLVVVGLL